MSSDEYRCPDDDRSTPTIKTVIHEFMRQPSEQSNAARNSEWLLNNFSHSCSNCYDGSCSCDFDGPEDYIGTHGIDHLGHAVDYFCVEFLSKHPPSKYAMQNKVTKAFYALFRYCRAKGYLSGGELSKMYESINGAKERAGCWL